MLELRNSARENLYVYESFINGGAATLVATFVAYPLVIFL